MGVSHDDTSAETEEAESDSETTKTYCRAICRQRNDSEGQILQVDLRLRPVVVVDERPILDDVDPRGKVVGDVGGKVVHKVDDTAGNLGIKDIDYQHHICNDVWVTVTLTMVLFMTRLGIKGKVANLNSQVKKAIMIIPPTTNMAIKEAIISMKSIRTSSPVTSIRSISPLTVLPLVVGTSVQTERQEDQAESESEQNETESIDPSPVKDHPRPDGSGSALTLNLFTEPQVGSSNGDGCDDHPESGQLARMPEQPLSNDLGLTTSLGRLVVGPVENKENGGSADRDDDSEHPVLSNQAY